MVGAGVVMGLDGAGDAFDATPRNERVDQPVAAPVGKVVVAAGLADEL